MHESKKYRLYGISCDKPKLVLNSLEQKSSEQQFLRKRCIKYSIHKDGQYGPHHQMKGIAANRSICVIPLTIMFSNKSM